MPTLNACTGFEPGTNGLLSRTGTAPTGVAGSRMFDVITGAPAVISTAPRSGTYCLELSEAGAISRILWDTTTFGTGKTSGVQVMYVYFPTSLPSANVVICGVNSAAAPNSWIQFTSAGATLSAQITSGTIRHGPTVVPDTWYRVEMHYNTAVNPHTLDWSVDGVAQTQATSVQAASTIAGFQAGWYVASTATIRYDDWCISTTLADYPLGAHKVRLLSVDPAGTLVLSGTAGNWSTFAGATPTLTAWNVTTARNNVDEVPGPNVQAAQDGFGVTAGTAGTEYVAMPMTSYALAAGETVSGVRAEIAQWQASNASGTLGMRYITTGAEVTLLAATAMTNLSNNSTTPGWMCKMCTLADVDTQAELDALTLRVGFSTDVTPAMGIHAAYAELAVKESAGTTWTVTPTDSAGLTDSASQDMTRAVAATDSAGLTDTAVLDRSNVVTDSAGLTDDAAFSRSNVITDSAGLTDTSFPELMKLVTATDSAGLTDTTALIRSAVVSDSAGLTDTTALILSTVTTDSVGLTDTSSLELAKTVSQTDSAGLTDTTALTRASAVTDSAGLTDTTALAVATVVTDSAGLTDTSTAQLVKLVNQTDSAGLTDTTAFAQARSVTDSVGLTDTQAVQQLKVVTDSAGLTDDAAVGLSRSVAATDSAGLTDTAVFARVLGRTVDDLAGLTDSLVMTASFSRAVTDSAGLTDAFEAGLDALPATLLAAPSGVVDVRYRRGAVDLQLGTVDIRQPAGRDDLAPGSGSVDTAPSGN